MNNELRIKKVDSVEIISIMDNSVDFLSTIHRKEVRKVRDWMKDRASDDASSNHIELPFAEHGFSMLIRVSTNGKTNTILFDTGISFDGVKINTERMGLNISDIECIVLSHGHYDHFGGLQRILEAIGKRRLPVIVHDHMFRIRRIINPDGTFRKYPLFPNIQKIGYGRYIKTESEHLIADDTILILGEIPRRTSFEQGLPRHQSLINNEWKVDSQILDDRGIIINLKNKGLLVISGCAHAGIINTVLQAKEVTGIQKIYGIMGGFHLSGKACEPRINATVDEIRRIDPEILVPSHCTGWRGISRISRVMTKAFVWNSVGNLYQL